MIIYTHPDCLLKENGSNHPERKERLDSVLESINQIKGLCVIDFLILIDLNI